MKGTENKVKKKQKLMVKKDKKEELKTKKGELRDRKEELPRQGRWTEKYSKKERNEE